MNKPKLNDPDVEQTTTTWGTTQSVSYSNYPLKNYKINFKELQKQEEQKIFKEFEEKGYKITKKKEFGQEILVIEKGYSLDVTVYKTKREYKTRLGRISIELHQLLHKLFEIWGWFDE